MSRRLHELNGRQIAFLRPDTLWQRHRWQANAAWVWIVARAAQLEDGHHGERAVLRLGAEAEVDVHQVLEVAGEPAGLEREGPGSVKWPGCSVGGRADAAAWVGPSHAEGEGCVGYEIVATPAGVGDDCVAVDDTGQGGEEGYDGS